MKKIFNWLKWLFAISVKASLKYLKFARLTAEEFTLLTEAYEEQKKKVH